VIKIREVIDMGPKVNENSRASYSSLLKMEGAYISETHLRA
jgi:hypothetical protein